MDNDMRFTGDFGTYAHLLSCIRPSGSNGMARLFTLGSEVAVTRTTSPRPSMIRSPPIPDTVEVVGSSVWKCSFLFVTWHVDAESTIHPSVCPNEYLSTSFSLMKSG